jgi:integrase
MITVAEILSAYRADREPIVVSIQRIDSAIRALQSLSELTVDDLTRQRLASHVAERIALGMKPSTVRREFATLRAAIRLAWKDRVIDRVPHITLPPRGQPRQRVLTGDELARMRAAAASNPDDELLWALLVGTCARLGALLELTWSRVDLERKLIDLRDPTHPRASRRKHRAVVPVDRALIAVLRRAAKRAAGDRVLPWRAASTVQRHLRNMARRAAVDGLTPHVMRHTMATILLRRVPLVVASRMLGHKSVAITEQEYGHLLVEDLLPAARAINGVLR